MQTHKSIETLEMMDRRDDMTTALITYQTVRQEKTNRLKMKHTESFMHFLFMVNTQYDKKQPTFTKQKNKNGQFNSQMKDSENWIHTRNDSYLMKRKDL